MALLRQCLAELRFKCGDIDDNDTAFLVPEDAGFCDERVLQRRPQREGAYGPDSTDVQFTGNVGFTRPANELMQAFAPMKA